MVELVQSAVDAEGAFAALGARSSIMRGLVGLVGQIV